MDAPPHPIPAAVVIILSLGDIVLHSLPLPRLRFAPLPPGLPVENLRVLLGAARTPGLSLVRPFPASGSLEVHVPAPPPLGIMVVGPGVPPLVRREDIHPGREPVTLGFEGLFWVSGKVKDAASGRPVTVTEAGLLGGPRHPGYPVGDVRLTEELLPQRGPPGTFRFPCRGAERARILLRTKTHGAVATGILDLTGPIELSLTRAPTIRVELAVEGKELPASVALWKDEGRVTSPELVEELRPKDGVVVFTAPVSGNYRVSVLPFDPDGAYAVSGIIEVGREDVTTSLPLGPGGAVHGRVVTADGKGVPGAWIEIYGGEDEEIFYRLKRTGTGADFEGRFRIRGLRPGVWKLRARDTSKAARPVLSETEVKVEAGGTVEVELRAR